MFTLLAGIRVYEDFHCESVLLKHLVESVWPLLVNPEREKKKKIFVFMCVGVLLCCINQAEEPSGDKHSICKAPSQ